MDAQEKLIALKRAYADIILNISKETAVRVMSSERRAARHQHELKVGKDEALKMLIRVKKMMDSKMRQSEIASQNQQKKIAELEAQLDEAEDIVKDLREELGQTQTKLERLKKEHSQHINEQTDAFSTYRSSENFFLLNSQERSDPRNECCKCNIGVVCTRCSFIRNRDLTSMTMKGKGPGLYRNGFTQRIRACEGDRFSVKKSSLSGENDEINDKKTSTEQRQREIHDRNPEIKVKKFSPQDEVRKEKTGPLEPNFSGCVGERVIKYTFQRKRKREALNASKLNAQVEIEKKSEGDKNTKQSKISSSIESSRESRRLAQVARQLISLSEKKWWN